MPDHRVIWVIDIIADTPHEAVLKAREYQMRPDTTATVFYTYQRPGVDTVMDHMLEGMEQIDLLPPDDYEITYTGVEWVFSIEGRVSDDTYDTREQAIAAAWEDYNLA